MRTNKTIWKFRLNTTDHQTIELTKGAEILTVQMQNGAIYLWVMLDPDAEKYEQGIVTHGTGHNTTENTGDYIGTYQLHDGELVFHVFKAL